LLRVYSVVVPAAELAQKLNAKIEEVRPRVRLNGFRPGKVPAAHIRKIYGPSMMQDVINEHMQKSTQASLEKVRPASEPRLELKADLGEVQAGRADLAFDLSVEIMPEFEPVDPSTLSVARLTTPVEESQVDEALAALVKENRSYEDKDGQAAEGDALTIDFVGKIDGEPFEGGSAEGATIVLGSKRFIPGFEDQLVGAKAGEERSLNVAFPDDYAVERLRGKTAVFDAKVHAVRAPKESAADDEFAKQLGLEKISDVRDALKNRIEAEHAGQSRAKIKRALFDQLDQLHNFDLPPGMVESEFGVIWRQVEEDRRAGRLEPDEAAKSEEDLRAEYRRIAERRVRLGLVLAEIGRRNKVEVTSKELDQALLAQARNFPGREREFIELYRQRPALEAQARAPIYEEKVVDFILELAKVKNETVSREELFAEDPV
jgi:trigger factor